MSKTLNPKYTATNIYTITGASGNEFNYLDDAIKKAYELGAPYTSATVNIRLKSEPVYLIRWQDVIFYPMATDDQ